MYFKDDDSVSIFFWQQFDNIIKLVSTDKWEILKLADRVHTVL